MAINAQILDSKKEGKNECFLASFSLKEYLSNLPSNYADYDVQREVVASNVYLDKMIQTVLLKKHIPTIVLVLSDYNQSHNTISFNSSDYKILDGLQRTHRLKMIFDTYNFFIEELNSNNNILKLKKYQISRTYSRELKNIKSNYKILFEIIEFYKKNDQQTLNNVFTDNKIWFELWSGLNSSQQVEKMLLLNAGHKPVKLKHQLELLFINDLLKEFKNKDKFQDFQLIREKEKNSTSFSKSRSYGEFHFSQIISSLIAFDKGKIIVTNTNLITKIQESDFAIQDLNGEISYNYINNFVEFILDFDKILKNNYSEYIKWFGRETSLVGLFASLGNYRIEHEVYDPKEIFDKLINHLNTHPSILNLGAYDEARKVLDLSKINFGTVNRKVVYSAFRSLLDSIDNPGMFPGEEINWRSHFLKFVK
jgi:hypothetical protein